MPVQLTIRNVPQPVKEELAQRAAREGKSMQEYLLGELERLASRPSVAEWGERVRARKEEVSTRVAPEEILRHRDMDRR